MSEHTQGAATLKPEILEEAREAFNAKFPIEFAGSRARAMAFSLWLDAWSAALASAQREERVGWLDMKDAPERDWVLLIWMNDGDLCVWICHHYGGHWRNRFGTVVRNPLGWQLLSPLPSPALPEVHET